MTDLEIAIRRLTALAINPKTPKPIADDLMIVLQALKEKK